MVVLRKELPERCKIRQLLVGSTSEVRGKKLSVAYGYEEVTLSLISYMDGEAFFRLCLRFLLAGQCGVILRNRLMMVPGRIDGHDG